MIKKISGQIINSVLANQANKKFDEYYAEVYKYGLEVLISGFASILSVLLIATLVRDVLIGIIYLFAFIPLRQFTGGFHANSYLKCNIYSIIAFLVVLLFVEFIFPLMPLVLLEILSLSLYVFILCFAPVSNKNKLISKRQKRFCKILSSIIYWILCLSALILYPAQASYSGMVLCTIYSVIVMLMLEEILKRRGHRE